MLRYTGHAILLVLGAIFIFHSPFTRWWAELGLPWYTVFLLWFILIALVALDSSSGSDSSTNDGPKDGRKNGQGQHGD